MNNNRNNHPIFLEDAILKVLFLIIFLIIYPINYIPIHISPGSPEDIVTTELTAFSALSVFYDPQRPVRRLFREINFPRVN